MGKGPYGACLSQAQALVSVNRLAVRKHLRNLITVGLNQSTCAVPLAVPPVTNVAVAIRPVKRTLSIDGIIDKLSA